jgi:hypothetical protein
MFREWVGNHGSILPLIAMVLFVGISLLVSVYILTDRRSAHGRRMSGMPLEDAASPEETGDV